MVEFARDGYEIARDQPEIGEDQAGLGREEIEVDRERREIARRGQGMGANSRNSRARGEMSRAKMEGWFETTGAKLSPAATPSANPLPTASEPADVAWRSPARPAPRSRPLRKGDGERHATSTGDWPVLRSSRS